MAAPLLLNAATLGPARAVVPVPTLHYGLALEREAVANGHRRI